MNNGTDKTAIKKDIDNYNIVFHATSREDAVQQVHQSYPNVFDIQDA